ncbi:MAG: hypothetical protein LBL79_03455 [Prevotella sp.]|jgi:hypothetical protein|nr:hypothetical protein [Prevotella sp.]
MNQDWIGNGKSIYKILGATSHSKGERECNDYYATEPKAVELLLNIEDFNNNILEPACGEGAISEVLVKHGYNVQSYDLIDRDYGIGGVDFLKCENKWSGDIITNPPYKYAQEFVEKSLELVEAGAKIAMFLKIQFLEGKKRRSLFDRNPPKTVYVSSSRLKCVKNGEFVKSRKKKESSAVAYCWYIWEKGYKGETIIKWFN